MTTRPVRPPAQPLHYGRQVRPLFGPTEPAPGRALPTAARVLFVGNSLTRDNNLPRTIADMASRAGLPNCNRVPVACPDSSLSDHYLLGDALTEFETRSYHFVVVQQAPHGASGHRAYVVAGHPGGRHGQSTCIPSDRGSRWGHAPRR